MYYIITLKTANHFIDNNLIQVITIISCYSMLFNEVLHISQKFSFLF